MLIDQSDVELIQEREAERAAFSSETVEKMKADLKEKTEDNDALTKKVQNFFVLKFFALHRLFYRSKSTGRVALNQCLMVTSI